MACVHAFVFAYGNRAYTNKTQKATRQTWNEQQDNNYSALEGLLFSTITNKDDAIRINR